MKKTIWLIDIDGTICEDIPNEEPEKFLIAEPIPGSLKKVKMFYEKGDRVTFFTARTDEHKEITEKWLDKHGFPYESVVYNKPRISEGETYHWVDNKPVVASCKPGGLR